MTVTLSPLLVQGDRAARWRPARRRDAAVRQFDHERDEVVPTTHGRRPQSEARPALTTRASPCAGALPRRFASRPCAIGSDAALDLLLRYRDLDLALEDLPCRGFRQVVDDPHETRVLVGRDALLHVIAQFLGCRFGPRL